MKIAICMSGQLRSWEIAKENQKWFWTTHHQYSEDNTPDYFIHTWDYSGDRTGVSRPYEMRNVTQKEFDKVIETDIGIKFNNLTKDISESQKQLDTLVELDQQRKDKIKIFQARTGFGKTYGSQNILMPELFNSHSVNLIVYAVPNTENIDPVSFKLAGDKHGYIFTSDVSELKSLLAKGGRVVFGATHSYINVKKNRNVLEELVEKYKSSWFIEECHSWLGVTHHEFYEDVMGYNTQV